ncbi:PIN domain-containing protein [Ruminococcaceae bacterium OttesenSCG-928-L11]|nr:PIN domain-containing protein [Ruminococcaceae bacterium OttesenSCG-928-L11]MDL2274141.1 PIN domain-containing protein [Oscillospiraceae bacterium OttesenSCG-928-G22]
MKIYLDNCCLNRPFDDLSQDRVYLEAEAILSIVSHCENGEWELMASGIIEYELSRLTDMERLEQVRTLYSAARTRLVTTEAAEKRAVFFQQQGIKMFDSLHLALAETGGADIFLTTDDRLLRAAVKLDLKIKVANPVSWLMEVTNDER